VLFVVICTFHLYLNFRVIKRYFQNRQSKRLALRPEWIAAFLVCVIILVGILRGVMPFVSLMRMRSEYRHAYPGSSGHTQRNSINSLR
jgi:hypothetical protein